MPRPVSTREERALWCLDALWVALMAGAAGVVLNTPATRTAAAAVWGAVGGRVVGDGHNFVVGTGCMVCVVFITLIVRRSLLPEVGPKMRWACYVGLAAAWGAAVYLAVLAARALLPNAPELCAAAYAAFAPHAEAVLDAAVARWPAAGACGGAAVLLASARFFASAYWQYYRDLTSGGASSRARELTLPERLSAAQDEVGATFTEATGLVNAVDGWERAWVAGRAAGWHQLGAGLREAALRQARKRVLHRIPFLSEQHLRTLCPELTAHRIGAQPDGVLRFAESAMARDPVAEAAYIVKHAKQLAKVQAWAVPVPAPEGGKQGMLTTTVEKAIASQGRKEGDDPLETMALLRTTLLATTAAEFLREASTAKPDICDGDLGGVFDLDDSIDDSVTDDGAPVESTQPAAEQGTDEQAAGKPDGGSALLGDIDDLIAQMDKAGGDVGA